MGYKLNSEEHELTYFAILIQTLVIISPIMGNLEVILSPPISTLILKPISTPDINPNIKSLAKYGQVQPDSVINLAK